MIHDEIGLVVSDPAQVILDSEPYRRLAFTWHTFTPEWAGGVGMDDATVTAWRAEPRSTVAFDIEPDDNGVARLTVVHGDFGPGSRVLEGISAGWPAVLASLKTMLETGSPVALVGRREPTSRPGIGPACTAILTGRRGCRRSQCPRSCKKRLQRQNSASSKKAAMYKNTARLTVRWTGTAT